MIVNPREQIVALTSPHTGNRLADGRPCVSDDILARMKLVTTEEAWAVSLEHGYASQFEGNWLNLHPEQVLVGRAVTAAFVPTRPDFHALIEAQGQEEGRVGGQNSWVIDTLMEQDVLVVDLFGKINGGTFAGDQLSTSIAARSRTGMVINGGIRDLQQVFDIPDFSVFVRDAHPTGIADVTLLGINIPIRIGKVTVLPGDIVLGTREGVIFIPPHIAEEVVGRSERVRLRDEFGRQRLREGRYTPGEIDRSWSPSIEADFVEWRKTRSY